MGRKIYEFQAVIEPVPEKGGAYVRFPYDSRKETVFVTAESVL